MKKDSLKIKHGFMDKNPELHKHKPRKRNATRKYNVSMIETVTEGKNTIYEHTDPLRDNEGNGKHR